MIRIVIVGNQALFLRLKTLRSVMGLMRTSMPGRRFLTHSTSSSPCLTDSSSR